MNPASVIDPVSEFVLKLVATNVIADTGSLTIGSGHPRDTLMEFLPPSNSNPGKTVDEERTHRIESDVGN